MAQTYPAQAVLSDFIWKAEGGTRILRFLALAFIGTLLIAISSKVKIPLPGGVDMTMQTFVILALGMAYGWRLAGATLLLYLAEGAAGLPVFTGTPEKGIGIAYMTGTTGGYLLGFLMAAVSVGWLAERGWDRNILTAAGAMLIGNVIIYVPGLIYLGALLGWDKPILEWGLYPFLVSDAIKLALAAAALPLAWKLLGRKG